MKWFIFAMLVLSCMLAAGCGSGIGGLDSSEKEIVVATMPAVESDQESVPPTAAEAEEEIAEDSHPLSIISINAYQFAYEPDRVVVRYGDDVLLTVTSLDVGCGFALPDFGVNVRVPAEESVQVRFTADRMGEFGFFNPVYSGRGWKDMEGKLVVE
ncbi:hypothetical protein JW898_02275 [Candidatus Woesearchaeota archaeon]|nr:hypothetical protein [Candidatus Woesearchaeota archaeon]